MERNSKNAAHGWHADGVNDKCERLEPCVQVCSILHVAHVYVRRVIHVIVHYGLTDVEGVLVVVHTFT